MISHLKNIKFSHFFWFSFFIFLALILIGNSFGYLDPDFGWHLQVGREIVRSGQVPHANIYNYTYLGNWVDHEWLADWFIAKAYDSFGYVFLSLLFALIVIITLIITFFFARRQPEVRRSPIILASVILFGLFASLPHLGVRIQEIALLFSVLVVAIIDRYQRRGDYRFLFFLTPIFYIWACSHASFFFGLFLLFAWPAVKMAEKILIKWRRPFWLDSREIVSWRKIIIFLVFALASLGVTLITAYRLELYSFLFGYRDTYYFWHIKEWLPQYLPPPNYWQLTYLWFGAVILISYICKLKKGGQLILRPWPLFLFVFLWLSAFQSRRHLPLFFFVSFDFLVYMLAVVSPGINRLGQLSKRWLKICLLVCLVILSLAQLAKIKWVSNPMEHYNWYYPVEAVKFLQSHPEYYNTRIFNEYVWGGYLIWADPSRLLFSDGRLPQVEFKGHSFLEEYQSFFRKETDQKEKLEEYGISLVLIKAKDWAWRPNKLERIIFRIKEGGIDNRNYLRSYLESAPAWQRIYQDQTAVIYYKKD